MSIACRLSALECFELKLFVTFHLQKQFQKQRNLVHSLTRNLNVDGHDLEGRTTETAHFDPDFFHCLFIKLHSEICFVGFTRLCFLTCKQKSFSPKVWNALMRVSKLHINWSVRLCFKNKIEWRNNFPPQTFKSIFLCSPFKFRWNSNIIVCQHWFFWKNASTQE